MTVWLVSFSFTRGSVVHGVKFRSTSDVSIIEFAMFGSAHISGRGWLKDRGMPENTEMRYVMSSNEHAHLRTFWDSSSISEMKPVTRETHEVSLETEYFSVPGF
jgi:hypothetical protein